MEYVWFIAALLYRGNKDLFPRSLLGGHCQYFLRGRCDFNNCRFKHTPLNLVPLHILEVALVMKEL